MTGAQIVSTLDDKAFAGPMRELRQFTANMRPLLTRIGVGMVDATQEHFREEKDPAGTPWRGLNPAYSEFKKGAGILREKAMHGGLMGSITFQVQDGHTLAWGSGTKYAAVHQFGAVIKPVSSKALVFRLGKRVVHAGKVTIPARPYLGWGEHEQVAAMDATMFTLNQLIVGHSARQMPR